MRTIVSWLATFALAGAISAPALARPAGATAPQRLTVLTYNVKGLPWPLASGRPEALARISVRLRAMRAAGKQPHIVVLQEAFTDAAKRIGRDAGYRYIVNGPSMSQRDQLAMTGDDRRFAAQASWLKGEGQGKLVDSGLQILSDLPVIGTARAAFPHFACAGYDCLANKGVLLVTVQAPGAPTPIAIATAHLNSGRASGVGTERARYAYRRQIDFLGAFFNRHRDPAVPLILAGDFNVGKAPGRRSALLTNVGGWWSSGSRFAYRDGLGACLAKGSGDTPDLADARYVRARARDWQFVTSGQAISVEAARISVPFGRRDPSGAMLSDHIGYAIDYRLTGILPPSAG